MTTLYRIILLSALTSLSVGAQAEDLRIFETKAKGQAPVFSDGPINDQSKPMILHIKDLTSEEKAHAAKMMEQTKALQTHFDKLHKRYYHLERQLHQQGLIVQMKSNFLKEQLLKAHDIEKRLQKDNLREQPYLLAEKPNDDGDEPNPSDPTTVTNASKTHDVISEKDLLEWEAQQREIQEARSQLEEAKEDYQQTTKDIQNYINDMHNQ